jgi:hypothetical protein
MRSSTIIAAAAAVALGGATIATAPASATPLGSSAALAQAGGAQIEQVRHGGRHWGHPRRHARPFHRDRRTRDRIGPAIVGGILGFGLGAALTAPRHAQPHHRTFAQSPHVHAHVQWCQQRYRSYDVTTDSFLSYDGNRYQCVSPYAR